MIIIGEKQQMSDFIQQLDVFLTQSENYLQTLQQTSLAYQNEFFNNIKRLIKEYKQNVEFTNKLQIMLTSQSDISKKINLKECLQQIEQECSKLLDCFKCKVMLFDNKNNEFVYLENQEIKKVKKDEGINSAVNLCQNVIRIDDAYQDPRFDRESDQLNNTKTNSLICAALIEHNYQDRQIIGIIQGINKHNRSLNMSDQQQENNKNQSFTKHDEIILTILAQHCTSQLLNCIKYNHIHYKLNMLQKLVDYQYSMFSQNTILDLIVNANDCLKEIVSNHNIRIFINKTYFNQNNHNKNRKLKEVNKNIGIMGQCLIQQTMICVKNPLSDQYYNQLVDIDTELPLITVPLKLIQDYQQDISQSNQLEVLGVIQFIDIRQLARNYLEQFTIFDDSIIQQFIKIFTLSLIKIINLDQKQI